MSSFGNGAGPFDPRASGRVLFGISTSQALRSPQLSPVRSPSISEVQGPQSRSLGFDSSPTLASHPSFTARPQMTIESPPTWSNGHQSFMKDDDCEDPVPYGTKSLVVTRNSGTTVAARVGGIQDQKRTRSPPHSTNGTTAQDSSLSFPQRPSDLPVHNANPFVKTNTPPLAFQKNPNAHARPSFGAGQSAAYSSPAWDGSSSMEGHFQDLGSRKKLSPGQVNDVRNGNLPKRSRSPPVSGSWQENPPVENGAKR